MSEEANNNSATSETPAPAATGAVVIESAPLKGIVGTKIGMTQIFIDDMRNVPVTVIASGGVVVTQVKTVKTDGYNAVQVGFEEVADRKLSKAEVGHLKKNNLKPMRFLHEFRVEDPSPFTVGQAVPVSVFAKGQWVQASGLNKGKGFAGVIKRHGFGGLPHSHGHHEYRRHPGSSAAQGPQHVFPGTRRGGHMGHEWSVVPKIEIVDIDTEKNLILLRGSVPGPNGNFVVITPTRKRIPVPQVKQDKKKGKK